MCLTLHPALLLLQSLPSSVRWTRKRHSTEPRFAFSLVGRACISPSTTARLAIVAHLDDMTATLIKQFEDKLRIKSQRLIFFRCARLLSLVVGVADALSLTRKGTVSARVNSPRSCRPKSPPFAPLARSSADTTRRESVYGSLEEATHR
jgi:hypothetical protein